MWPPLDPDPGGPRRGVYDDERGQTATEYVVLSGMLAAICLAGFKILGGSMREAFRSAAMQVLSAVTGP